MMQYWRYSRAFVKESVSQMNTKIIFKTFKGKDLMCCKLTTSDYFISGRTSVYKSPCYNNTGGGKKIEYFCATLISIH